MRVGGGAWEGNGCQQGYRKKQKRYDGMHWTLGGRFKLLVLFFLFAQRSMLSLFLWFKSQ